MTVQLTLGELSSVGTSGKDSLADCRLDSERTWNTLGPMP